MIDLRDEYVTRFGAIEGIKTAEARDQMLDLAEIERLGAKRSPLVAVTCVSAPVNEDRDTELVLECRWVAVVAAIAGDARRESQESRGDVAHLLAQRVIRELLRGDPFEAALSRADEVELANLSTTAVARKGYSLWGIAWRQDAGLDDTTTGTLEDLLRIHTNFDTTGDGTPETSDQVSYA